MQHQDRDLLQHEDRDLLQHQDRDLLHEPTISIIRPRVYLYVFHVWMYICTHTFVVANKLFLLFSVYIRTFLCVYVYRSLTF